MVLLVSGGSHTQHTNRHPLRSFVLKKEIVPMFFHSSGQGFVRLAHLSLASRVLFMVWLALPLALWPSISAYAAAPASTPIPADLTATPVSFQGSGGITLHGTIFDPAHTQGGRSGVVLVSGSGTGLRTETQPDAIAFAQQGLSTLIYDKRSVGYSPFQLSYLQLADDALAAVQTLRAHAGVDPKKVGIWGLSEGGWVAPLAAERSIDVAFVIVVGANAISPLQQQTWAVANALHRDGVSGSLITHSVSPGGQCRDIPGSLLRRCSCPAARPATAARHVGKR